MRGSHPIASASAPAEVQAPATEEAKASTSTPNTSSITSMHVRHPSGQVFELSSTDEALVMRAADIIREMGSDKKMGQVLAEAGIVLGTETGTLTLKPHGSAPSAPATAPTTTGADAVAPAAGDPPIGQRVIVTMPDGRERPGIVAGAERDPTDARGVFLEVFGLLYKRSERCAFYVEGTGPGTFRRVP
jgi:hypothetical protein